MSSSNEKIDQLTVKTAHPETGAALRTVTLKIGPVELILYEDGVWHPPLATTVDDEIRFPIDLALGHCKMMIMQVRVAYSDGSTITQTDFAKTIMQEHVYPSSGNTPVTLDKLTQLVKPDGLNGKEPNPVIAMGGVINKLYC